MNVPLLVDTDVLVDYLRGNPKAKHFIDAHQDKITLSAISVAEIHAGVRDDSERTDVEELLSLFPVYPVTKNVAVKGGEIARRFRQSHGVGLGDAIIAATAELAGAELRTLNVKHYPVFKSLKPTYRKG